MYDRRFTHWDSGLEVLDAMEFKAGLSHADASALLWKIRVNYEVSNRRLICYWETPTLMEYIGNLDISEARKIKGIGPKRLEALNTFQKWYKGRKNVPNVKIIEDRSVYEMYKPYADETGLYIPEYWNGRWYYLHITKDILRRALGLED